jgi:hypothetical protein
MARAILIVLSVRLTRQFEELKTNVAVRTSINF